MDWVAALTGVFRGAEGYRLDHAGPRSWEVLDALKAAAWMREALRWPARQQYEGDRSDHAVSAEAFAQSIRIGRRTP